MQPVWPRVRLVRPHTTRYLRRLSTASEALRSSTFHSSTFLYAGALAAAAYADGSSKLKAKNEWEKEIGAKQDEINLARKATQEKAQRYLMNRLGLHIDNDSDHFEEIFRELEGLETSESPAVTAHMARQREESELRRLLRHAPYLQVRRAEEIPVTSPFSNWSLAPQSPWSLAPARRRAETKAWVPKKLFRAEICAMRLVIEILLHTGLYNQSVEEMNLPYYVRTYMERSEEELQGILRKIEEENIRMSKLAPLVKPMHAGLGVLEPYYDPATTLGSIKVRELNKRLFEKLSEWHQTGEHDMSQEQIIYICETILRSSVHPDIHTCNILLTMFGARNQEALIDMVWDFIYDVHFRPNEVTLVQLFRSYIRRSNGQRFLQLLSQVRGKSGALMLATPEVTEEHITKTDGRVFPLYAWDTSENTKHFVQAAAPSPLVFREIIRGLLDFVGLETTMAICMDLDRYGWGLSYDCIHTLLRKCAVESDWETGVRVWTQTEQLLTQGYAIPTDIYALMLAFCHLLEDKDLFKKLFNQCLRNIGIDTVVLVGKVRQELAQIRFEQTRSRPRLYGDFKDLQAMIEDRSTRHEHVNPDHGS
jgi:hypothetical protein